MFIRDKNTVHKITSFTCFTMNIALTEKRNSLKDFGYSVIFDTIYLIIWLVH